MSLQYVFTDNSTVQPVTREATVLFAESNNSVLAVAKNLSCSSRTARDVISRDCSVASGPCHCGDDVASFPLPFPVSTDAHAPMASWWESVYQCRSLPFSMYSWQLLLSGLALRMAMQQWQVPGHQDAEDDTVMSRSARRFHPYSLHF